MSVSSRRLALGAMAALSLAGAAVVAVAQTPPTPPSASSTTTEVTTSKDGKVERRVIIRRGPDGAVINEDVRGRREGRGAGRDRMRLQPMVQRNPETRAEQLRTLLQLTPAQNGALAAYIAATAPPEPGEFMPARTPGVALTAIERADRAADVAGKVAAEARKRADATRTFYAALNVSQRKVFDSASFGGPHIVRIRETRGMPPMPPMPPAPPAPPRAG